MCWLFKQDIADTHFQTSVIAQTCFTWRTKHCSWLEKSNCIVLQQCKYNNLRSVGDTNSRNIKIYRSKNSSVIIMIRHGMTNHHHSLKSWKMALPGKPICSDAVWWMKKWCWAFFPAAECHNGLCQVDLSVSAKLPVGVEVPYVIGSTALISLLVTVTNSKMGLYLPNPARNVRLNLPLDDNNNLVPAWYPEGCSVYKVYLERSPL